jgi:putative transposase
MSRKTIHLLNPDLCAHVYNRGVNREAIFLSPWHYEYFLKRLQRCIDKIPVLLLSYTLMPNHFHLILQQTYTYSLSHFMKLLCDGYAKTFNLILGRKGHVFEGDYGLRPIYDQGDLLNLTRYIHRNPLRAGLVEDPLSWEYSSARTFCGEGPSLLVDPGSVLSPYGIIPSSSYRDYLSEGNVPSDEWLKKYAFRNRK